MTGYQWLVSTVEKSLCGWPLRGFHEHTTCRNIVIQLLQLEKNIHFVESYVDKLGRIIQKHAKRFIRKYVSNKNGIQLCGMIAQIFNRRWKLQTAKLRKTRSIYCIYYKIIDLRVFPIESSKWPINSWGGGVWNGYQNNGKMTKIGVESTIC